jgi:hyperosmotically inducible periplasmic protein
MKNKTTALCRTLALSLSTAALLFTAAGCAGDRYNRSTGEYIDDNSLRLRVNSALADNPDYKFEGVNVIAFKGTVQLGGFVDLSDQKTKAGDIVMQVPGVKDVVNNLTVKNQSASSATEYADDKSLTARVKSALANNPDYKFGDVVVVALKGTVQLSGFVNTAEQKSRAMDVAKEVPGVKDIANNITVKDKL